jgi:hypothetical protein
MAVSQTPGAKSSRHNPNAIRRCVRREFTAADIAGFVTKSFTREDIKHHAEIDLQTGELRCSCEDFKFRKNPMVKKLDNVHAITIKTPMLWCKHCVRVVNNCVRNGELIQNADKSYSLNHPQAAPVEAIQVPAHIHAETGELKPGYLPNGQVDYNAMFD